MNHSATQLEATPKQISLQWDKTALLIIDMQRDFLESGGFGESLGNDVSQLRHTITPNIELLAAWRAKGLTVIHTREGHLPDLSDVPANKLAIGEHHKIGDHGAMGRILIIGEAGQDIIPELYPINGEKVIDKPGKGAFYNTDLDQYLKEKQIDTLLVCGVTSEVCVNSSIREATDRGYRCVAIEDCCASYFPELHQVAMRLITSQGGIFGWVSNSSIVKAALGST